MKKLITLSLIIICGCGSNEKNDSQESVETNTNESSQAPNLADFQFTDLEGNTFSGEKYKGQPVFVHFWATWCRPCIVEMPTIATTMENIEGMQFIFPSDEKIETIRGFSKKNDFPFQYLQINSGFQKIGVSALPTTYIFNENGELQEMIVGAQDWESEEAVSLLREITSGAK